MQIDEKLSQKVQQLKLTEHWDYFYQMLADRYKGHHTELETTSPEKLSNLQGKISELKEILAWFEETAQFESLQIKEKIVHEKHFDEY